MTSYSPADPPQMLRLLLKAARTMNRPVEVIWLDADDEPCGGIVTVVEAGREDIRIRTENGVDKTIRYWDVWSAALLDAGEEQVA